VIPRRDLRTVYLHEVAIYEAAVPLAMLLTGTGVPPFFFFAALRGTPLVGADFE
jgi:hypothetical protein